jgi:ribosomal protein S18 acetylase RimI-like enzyme
MDTVPSDITIRSIDTPEDAAAWRAGFVGAYQSVFSGFPYFERFYPSEAEGVYRKLLRTPNRILLVATRGVSQVVGFGAAIPLEHKPSVAAELTGLVPIRHTYYLAELGVIEPYRGKGIGQTLIRERIQRMDKERHSHVVLRVSMNNNPSRELYESLGFEEMGVYMDVSAMRTDGKVTTDRRQFMSRVLSQVKV